MSSTRLLDKNWIKKKKKKTGYNGTNGDKIVFPASAQDFTEMGSNTCGTWQM